MARHFVRLKLALIRNGLRGSSQRAVGLVVAALIAIPMAVGGFAILASARGGSGSVSGSGDGRLIAVLVFSGLFFAWVLLPVVGFGSDETLDPARLALLPLDRGQLFVGLFAASCVGVAPVATLLAISGALVGFTTSIGALVVVPLAVVVELALCLTASRAVVTALSGLLRSRRGRDVTITVMALLGVLLQVARFALIGHVRGIHRAAVDRFASWLSWTPPGLVGRAMASAAAGHIGPAFGALGLGVVSVGLLGWWWLASLDHVLTSAEGGTQRRPSAPRGRGAMFPRALAFLPRNRIGVVAAKELRYLARDPRRRAQLVPAIVLPLLPMVSAIRSGHPRPSVTVAALIATVVPGQLALNQFGLDGAAYWTNMMAGNDPAADMTGKNLAVVIIAMPLVAVSALGLAAISGGWAYVPVALALALGVLGVQLGVGNVTSVRAPQPVPESRTNMWGTNTGQGCANGLLIFLALVVEALLLIPVGVGVIFGVLVWAPSFVISVPFTIAYGGLVWWIGRRSAARFVWWRQPELLEAIGVRSAA